MKRDKQISLSPRTKQPPKAKQSPKAKQPLKAKQPPKAKQSPIKNFLITFKRLILATSVMLFCSVGYATYLTSHDVFSNRAGRVFTWSTATLVSPLIKTIPWWFWCGLFVVASYLWYKHKLVMSIIYGIIVGLYLAT
jgi:hypothetical protein